MKRAIIIVLDGVGVGELPDAHFYGDAGANTLANVAQKNKGINLPNLQKLGIGNIIDIAGVKSVLAPKASYGKMAEKAKGKDSISGHWEISGIDVSTDFPIYQNGFSDEIIEKFVQLSGINGVLVNEAYSGTEVIKDYGKVHIKTKKPIVYTSADSVFQIACHEEIFPISELYEMCRIARNQIFNGATNIGRVIARPFLGSSKDGFYRTPNRKDYAISPPTKTLLDLFKENNFDSIGIGKIEDLFNFQGLTSSFHTTDNVAGIDKTIEILHQKNEGLIFVNLVDFDSKWGHRNNYIDFAKGLEYFDEKLEKILNALNEDDLLFITADHGCDPTFKGTDHTREFIPLIVYGQKFRAINLQIRNSFSDIAKTIADYFDLKNSLQGESFLDYIK